MSPHSPAGAAAPVVQITGIYKTFGTGADAVRAVEGVSLDVHSGEFVAILGPSGCGKSTLLNMIAGLLPATTGTIQVMGKPVTGPVTELGIVFQQHLLLPWRTIINNVLLQIEVRRRRVADYRERALGLLRKVGLADFSERFPDELSGGMNQRAAICRALIHDPPVILMDEPFGALDALTRDQMALDFHRLSRDEGMTVLFVTHSINEAVFLSDRVVLFSPRPGSIKSVVPIKLGRTRHLDIRDENDFTRYTRQIREEIQEMGLLREDRQ
jgi:NitT/TauT family transport system ATP-binding protein